MAMSLAAFNGARRTGAGAAGAHPRPALRRQDLARLLRGAVLGRPRRAPSAIPVLTIDGPTASGKGTLASAVAAALGYHPARLRRGLPGDRDRRAATPASPPTTKPALAALAGSARPALRRPTGSSSAAPTSPIRCAARKSARWPRAISAWPAVRAAVLGVQLAFRRLPGLVADGRDMGTVVFPDADAQGLPHRERRRTGRAALQAVDFKGNFR